MTQKHAQILILWHFIFAAQIWVYVLTGHLIAVDADVMGRGEGFKHDNPAGIGRSLKQRVSHLRDVDVSLIGGWDQIWAQQKCTHLPILLKEIWKKL